MDRAPEILFRRVGHAAARVYEHVARAASNSSRDGVPGILTATAVTTVVLVLAPPTVGMLRSPGQAFLLVAPGLVLAWAAVVAATVVWCWTMWGPGVETRLERARARTALWAVRCGAVHGACGLDDARHELGVVTAALTPAERRSVRRRAQHLIDEVDLFVADSLRAGLVRFDPELCALRAHPAHEREGAVLIELIEHRRRRLVALTDEARTAVGGTSVAARLAAQIEVDRCDVTCTPVFAERLSA